MLIKRGLLFFLIPIVCGFSVQAAILSEIDLNVTANIVADTCELDDVAQYSHELGRISIKDVLSGTGLGYIAKVKDENEKIKYKCPSGNGVKISILPQSNSCKTPSGVYNCGGTNTSVGMLPELKKHDGKSIHLFGGKPLTEELPLKADKTGEIMFGNIYLLKLSDANNMPSPGEISAEFVFSIWSY